MDRVFLDANVLFSAAYRDESGLRELWRQPCRLLTSSYALEEARRNLETDAQRERLEALVREIEVIAHEPSDLDLEVGLPLDDRPILAAAIRGRASHLLSGDRRAFGVWYGERLKGVEILRPAEYLRGED